MDKSIAEKIIANNPKACYQELNTRFDFGDQEPLLAAPLWVCLQRGPRLPILGQGRAVVHRNGESSTPKAVQLHCVTW